MPGDTVVPTEPTIPTLTVPPVRAHTVVIRLAYDYGAFKADDLYASDELTEELAELRALLGAVGAPPAARAVRNTSAEALWSTELETRRAPFTTDLPPERWRSLTRYWRVDLSDRPEAVGALLERLRSLPGVELAYAEGRIVDAGLVSYTSDPFAAGDPAVPAQILQWQGYQAPSPTGVDARYAWDAVGGTAGAGVGLVDLEVQWFKTHEDLDVVDSGTGTVTAFETAVPLLYGVNAVDTGLAGYSGSHGASVWGVVFGRDNTLGGVGLAPALERPARISHMVPHDGGGYELNHFTEAIVEAVRTHLQPGDVLLIESQMSVGLDLDGGPATVEILSPIEVQALERDAIQLAVSRGVVVIEPAGNGAGDLDDTSQFWGGIFVEGSADFEDSGAILVGASTPPDHNSRFFVSAGSGSNYGSRVNCFAWGANVVTCGRSLPTPDSQAYVTVFNGTSSASAIVAGVAVLVQSYYKAHNGGAVLSPLQMRAVLSDPSLGLDRGNLGLGVMPDLRRVLPSLASEPDVFLRDNLSDTGVVPSAGTLSSSPDIIVRQHAVANPDASFGELSANRDRVDLGEEVVAGHDHYIYVRAMNRGGASASSTSARVFWSPPATLVTPDLWTEIGSTPTMSVPSGGALRVSGPLVWPASELPGPGHYCFVALLGDDQDPAPPVPQVGNDLTTLADFLSYVRDNNNVAWRNFNVVHSLNGFLGVVGQLPFWVVGAPGEDLPFDLELLQSLPHGAQVWLHLHPDMRGHWWARRGWFPTAFKFGQWLPVGRDRRVELGSFKLAAGARHACRLAVLLPRSDASLRARIAIRQVYRGEEVGRITWQFGAAKI